MTVVNRRKMKTGYMDVYGWTETEIEVVLASDYDLMEAQAKELLSKIEEMTGALEMLAESNTPQAIARLSDSFNAACSVITKFK